MKHKMLALVLALTVASWAQTATQTAPSDPQQSTVPAEKTKCACCDKMASGNTKAEHSCCAHHEKQTADSKEAASCGSGKDAKSCCSGKDAKSCMKGDKNAGSCCKDSCGKDKTASASCGKQCGKDCCSPEKKTATNCCRKDIRG
jgi:hypothetical protein